MIEYLPYALIAVLVVAALTAAWFSWTAARLDRLHLRREAAEAALRLQLVRRASAAIDVASVGMLDPASALLLAEAGQRARDLDDEDAGRTRWRAESDLTSVIAEIEPSTADPLHAQAWDGLCHAGDRAAVARRIHNDLTTSVLGLRDRRRVRWFGLAGHADRPAMIEIDDRVPGRR